jgi:molybdate transport system substrate-binding protein
MNGMLRAVGALLVLLSIGPPANAAELKAELGLIVIPNIMSVPGAELVGPLPAEINSVGMFTAGVSAQSPNQQAARALIKLLKSPEARSVIKAKGNDPA